MRFRNEETHVRHTVAECSHESFSDTELLDLFSRHIKETTGIDISPAKYHLLGTKLARMVSREGYEGIHDVYRLLRSDGGRTGDLLIRYITTTYTYFFRESSQLDSLVREAKARNIKRPLIWCAASSTGEEAYSIAIALQEAGFSDYLIMASDINPTVLGHMHRGIYKPGQLQFVSGDIRNKYFVPCAGERENLFRVCSSLRRNLFIRRLNLLDRPLFEDRFDFILCRNTLIYFDEESRNDVLGTLERNLHQKGLLFLGKSESLLSNRLFVRYEREPAVYCKRF